MRCPKILLAAAGLMFIAPPNTLAVDVKLIANPSVKADTISPEEIKRVFLQEKTSLADGSYVEPVIEKDGPSHEAFLKMYMGRTDDDLRTYYRALVFTGRGSMPKELDSDNEMVACVARTKGAIGYVSAETSSEGVKILAVAHARDSAQRTLITRVEPQYPETLRRLNIGGIVRLRVTISAKGNVEEVQLLGGNPILGESALSAVRRWIYAPSHSRTVAEVSIPFDTSH
ncbi:MAG: TonB family protein [Candidatus Sulfotelmatobacter sp.]